MPLLDEEAYIIKQTRIKFAKIVGFVLGLAFELFGAASIIGSMYAMERLIDHKLTIFGVELHKMVVVAESCVLLCFIFTSLLSQLMHMFERQIQWLLSLFKK